MSTLGNGVLLPSFRRASPDDPPHIFHARRSVVKLPFREGPAEPFLALPPPEAYNPTQPVKSRTERKQPKATIPVQTLRRIPFYHQILSELEARGDTYVSSHYLAGFFKIDDTQVRKDVSVIGYKGKPKSGYQIRGLKRAIGEFLGINVENTAILIGAGKLASALSEYAGFAEFGLRLKAIFDSDPKKIGKVMGGLTILSIDSLPRVVRSFDIGIAILTVPKEAAQKVCDLAISLGIKAVWNFAPTQLKVPPDVAVRNENLAVGVAVLSHHLKRKETSPED
jgi:redox-sensing transcriptional repressor